MRNTLAATSHFKLISTFFFKKRRVSVFFLPDYIVIIMLVVENLYSVCDLMKVSFELRNVLKILISILSSRTHRLQDAFINSFDLNMGSRRCLN